MTDARTNLSKHIANEVRENYGQHIKVFKTEIPRVVKTSEASLSVKVPSSMLLTASLPSPINVSKGGRTN